MATDAIDRSQHVLPNDTGIVVLNCKDAFDGLTNEEQLYSHYLSQASWYGSLSCLFQTSPESPGIFLLLQKLFRAQSAVDLKELGTKVGLTGDEYRAFLIYAAGFYSNLGNYKSFGDTKFIPDVPEEKFEALIKESQAYKSDPACMQSLLDKLKGPIFSLNKKELQLGLGDNGITTYFSGNCVLSDAELAQEFLDEKKLSAYNTRLFKTVVDGKPVYEVKLASMKTDQEGAGDAGIQCLGVHQFVPKGQQESVTFKVTRGDYSPFMKLLADHLALAKKYTSNDNEKKMLDSYIRSFTEGSIEAHKEGSRHWIRNKGPIVETYIGFIESYRDPFGVRGEFEGFVAMVNKAMSAKFAELVEKAEHFLPLLPWPSSYEKDRFLRPDFTSLDVLSFASSGIPAGINIPNYDDIRQQDGFKNVSLGNVLGAGYKDTKITFLTEEDKELFGKYKAPSFEVQVGLHELLGHGSGKLFMKNEDGSLNFDAENIHHTETGEKIESYYQPGESWDSKFPVISSPYEECRAECVGIYLCLSGEILRIFGHTGQVADDIIYVNWLNMVRAGLCGLEFYSPSTETWRQAHMQARYVILRVLMEAGDGLVTIEKTVGEDGEPDLLIKLDRSKINTVGKKAIGDFLRKLQVYKATADYTAGKAMFERYSAVTDKEAPHFLSLRSTVLARKQARKMFVQSHTQIEADSVKLTEYEGTAENLIQSFKDRFPSADIDNCIQQLWEKETLHFS